MSRATSIVEKLMWLWIALLIVSGAQLWWWWFDRSPPFRLLSYSAKDVRAGEELRIDGTVWRDLNRNCSVVASRYILDSKDTRYDVTGMFSMTADALRRMDAVKAGELHLAIMTPASMAKGPAQLVTVLQYACNPLQEFIRPIDLEMVNEFEVLQ